MTEKRFVYYEHKGADYILDTPNTELDFIEMLGDCLEAEEIVDLLNELHESLTPLQEICNKYNINLDDLPDILEEYILIDNEVIEQKNIQNIIKEAYLTERTALGKSVLKQVLESL